MNELTDPASTDKIVVQEEVLQHISPAEKETILLASLYFYEKHRRRGKNFIDFDDIPDFDSDDSVAAMKAFFKLILKGQADIEGDAPGKISEILIHHPRRHKLFGHLTDAQMSIKCNGFDAVFEEQDYVDGTHGEDPYRDFTPVDFAIYATEKVLFYGRHAGYKFGTKFLHRVTFPLVPYIEEEAYRIDIIKAIIRESLSNGSLDLLPSGENLLPPSETDAPDG